MYHLKMYRPRDSFCTFISESVPLYNIYICFYVIYKYLDYSFIMVILNIIVFFLFLCPDKIIFLTVCNSNENTIFELQ